MANIGTLGWCVDKIYDISRKLNYYEKKAEIFEETILKTAGRETLLALIADLDVAIEVLGNYRIKEKEIVKVYDQAQQLKDKIYKLLYPCK